MDNARISVDVEELAASLTVQNEVKVVFAVDLGLGVAEAARSSVSVNSKGSRAKTATSERSYAEPPPRNESKEIHQQSIYSNE
jgi:hypothetical protein